LLSLQIESGISVILEIPLRLKYLRSFMFFKPFKNPASLLPQAAWRRPPTYPAEELSRTSSLRKSPL
jgi:hypothetical protein